MAELYRRRSLGIGGWIEDNPLSSSATTLTSAGLAAVGTLATDEYMAIILDPDGNSGVPEIAYITAHTSGIGTATIARGKEGTTARACDRDTAWVHGATLKDFQTIRHARRTSADVTTTSTTWTNFDTGIDLTLPAFANDVIEAGISCIAGNSADYGFMDVGTLVSSAIVNVFSTGAAESGSNQGVKAWQCMQSIDTKSAGCVLYTLQSGDIATGNIVTCRLRIRCNSGTGKTWRASATEPFQWYIKNLGPAGVSS